jgi:glycerol kinase
MGFWEDIEEIRPLIREEEIFYPQISLLQRKALLDRWHELLKTKGILS